MIYAVLFEDNEQFADRRRQFMPDHLKFLEDNQNAIQAAGPLNDAVSNASAGGLWLVTAKSVEEVQRLVEEDPFWPTGLRKSIRMLAWTQVFVDGVRQI